MGRYNGFGTGFYGRRDEWSDGSYATTHCVSALWIPVIPIGAYRVRSEGEGYLVMAREQLSGFAKFARVAVIASVVLAIAAFALHAHYTDPKRLARIRFDDTLEAAASATPEASLRSLDAELERDDLIRVGADRAQRAGAAVVTRTAGFASTPFRADELDQAGRLVRRYQALPELAKGGVAQDAVLAVLDRWVRDLAVKPDTAEARLALLRHAAELADPQRAAAIASQIATLRLEAAAARQAEWPLDALAILAEQFGPEAIASADAIVARLVDSPSLLADAGADLDGWLAATESAELRAKVLAQRALAIAAGSEVEAETVTAAQLTAMARPPARATARRYRARGPGQARARRQAGSTWSRVQPPRCPRLILRATDCKLARRGSWWRDLPRRIEWASRRSR